MPRDTSEPRIASNGGPHLFVHAVYFWLNEGLSERDKEMFLRGVNALTTIESVQQGHVGIPADTHRPVVDSSYSYALVVVFRDKAGHDFYQAHPVHDRFRKECAPFWHKVVIYDSVAQP